MNIHPNTKALYSYVRREMPTAEKERFETEMLSDHFLAEAVEGFQTDAEALKDLPKFSSPSFSWLYVLGFAIIGIGLLGFLFNNKVDQTAPEILYQARFDIPEVNNSEAAPKMNVADLTPASQETPQINEEAKPQTSSNITEENPMIFEIVAYEQPLKPSVSSCPGFKPAPKLKLPNPEVLYFHDLKVAKPSLASDDFEEWKDAFLKNVPANKEVRTNEDIYAKYYENPDREEVFLIEIENALRLFTLKEYEESLNRFQSLSDKFPSDVSVQFYLGLCHYKLDQIDEALAYFARSEKNLNRTFLEEAQWYQSLCLIAIGDNQAAKIKLSQVLRGDGHYSIDAASQLARLEVKNDL